MNKEMKTGPETEERTDKGEKRRAERKAKKELKARTLQEDGAGGGAVLGKGRPRLGTPGYFLTPT